ncbi:L-histidine N(alpha)-methyltransferase [Candidatus Pacearchaeota archaeon]|nr:L-histidine N(alpha)-methyltransferase [Candidatus Pacearchaeota archaeon]
MELKESLFQHLVKNGYAKNNLNNKVWNLANRSFLYMTSNLAKASLRVRDHPRYKKTIIEIEDSLIKKHAKKFLGGLEKEPFNLIVMGCGDGKKVEFFLKSIGKNFKMRFCPVNPHRYLNDLISKKMNKKRFSNIIEYYPHLADLESLGEVSSMVKNGRYQKNLILLLGSIIASYEIHDYLFNLSQAMFNGDRIIIGNGIRTGERLQNIKSYRHPLFKKWLIHLIREVGFKPREVEYDTRFGNSRVECFFKVKKDKTLLYKGNKIKIKKGDEIIVAILYKYYAKELQDFCKMYFKEVKLVKDKANEYALILCQK